MYYIFFIVHYYIITFIINIYYYIITLLQLNIIKKFKSIFVNSQTLSQRTSNPEDAAKSYPAPPQRELNQLRTGIEKGNIEVGH